MTDFILDSLFKGLRPEQDLTVSEWADRHRILSSVASAEPGQWRTERFPFLREIMDALSSNSIYETITFMKGAQVGATEAGSNWLGYVIHQAPGPMLVVMPTVEMAKDNSKTRIDPLIEESPVLKNLIREPRSRDSGNTTLLKEFDGGFIGMIGANSPNSMRSKPIRYLFLDEVDSYPGDVGNEGDPVSLAKARTRTFARRKIFMVSTPTIKDKSRIEKSFNETDQRFYFVPCPHCHFKQRLVFKNLKWINKDPRTTFYECENCAGKIYNHDKNYMLSLGEWRATNKTNDYRNIGFHLSSLYSPVGFYSWEDAVSEWLAAQKNQMMLKTFVNTVLGETWEEKGEAPEWERLYARRDDYEIGIVPDRGLLLVAGADVQQDRIEIEIVAYGRNLESFSVDYIVIPGDVSQPAIWNKVDELLSREFIHQSGEKIMISGFAIDSGFESAHVYNWTRKKDRSKVFAVKGEPRLKTIVSSVKVLDIRLKDGKRIPRGARLWGVGINVIKSELYSFLRQDKPDAGQTIPYGFCHFPGYGEEYFRQLTAETLIQTNKKNGQVSYEWKKTRERNEALDCRVYARAAASIMGIDRFTELHWRKLEYMYGLKIVRQSEPETPQAPARQTQVKKINRVFSRGVKI